MNASLLILGLLFARIFPLILLLVALSRGLVGWLVALSAGLALSVGLSLGVGPLPDPSALLRPASLVLSITRELCLGSLAALALLLPLAAFGWAARFSELAWSGVSRARSGPIATAYVLAALVLCLNLGLERSLVIGLQQSVLLAPPGRAGFDSAAFGLGVVRLVGEALALSLAVGLPLLCACLVVEAALALVRRGLGRAAGQAVGPALAQPLFLLLAAVLLWPAVVQAPAALRVGLRLLRELTLRSAS
ncbi:MAG: flagellar biosynthetic protein FliR [Myxococcales bacterium]